MPRDEFEAEHEAGRNLSTDEASKLAYAPAASVEAEDQSVSVEAPDASDQGDAATADSQVLGEARQEGNKRVNLLYEILLFALIVAGVVAALWIWGRG